MLMFLLNVYQLWCNSRYLCLSYIKWVSLSRYRLSEKRKQQHSFQAAASIQCYTPLNRQRLFATNKMSTSDNNKRQCTLCVVARAQVTIIAPFRCMLNDVVVSIDPTLLIHRLQAFHWDHKQGPILLARWERTPRRDVRLEIIGRWEISRGAIWID